MDGDYPIRCSKMYPKDERLEKVEQITIDWEVFKKTLKRNYLSNDYYKMRQDRSFVLRLYPPFEAEMEVEYYESMQGRHYDSNWDEKPFHINPELIILAGTNEIFGSTIPDYPTENQLKNTLSEEDIEDEGGIEESLKISRGIFWDEVKHILPDSFDLGSCHGAGSYKVDINWTNL